MIATKASITDLEAAVARIGEIESTYITAHKVKADYMEVANWTHDGLIRADMIDVDTIVAKLGEFDSQIRIGHDIIVGDGVHCRRITFGATEITSSAKWVDIIDSSGNIHKVLCQN